VAKDKRRAELDKFLAQSRELPAPPGSPSEQVIWLILASHGSKEGADRSMKALWKRYVDVNEFRVAKAAEIASIIGRNVRGDVITVSEESRGFLRRFHKDQHTIDWAATESMTIEQLRKYLAAAGDSAKELGLAIFLHYCRRAEAADAEEAQPPPADGAKPKKRGDKDLAQIVDRLRLTAALAAKGEVVAKTREAQAARGLVAAWRPGSAPEAPPMPEPPPPPDPRAIPQPATPPPEHVPSRGGKGAARPHTSRGSKARTDNKGSSRR
jgi:hypothetical protein